MPSHSADSVATSVDEKGKDEIHRDMSRNATALSTSEVVGRFGSANAEYIKGYSGVDNQTGQKLAKSLKGIAQGKVNPSYVNQNLKQQAGYSAEVAATSKDNAEAIINKSKILTSRSDDLSIYGKNHNVVDRVQILDGQVIEGSQAQMKFVGNRDQLFRRIAGDNGKFARYRGIQLELPTEQFEGAEGFCRNKAEELRKQAANVGGQGKPEAAAKLLREADNYDELARNVRDSGLTTKEAIFYRNHPKISTALDIAKTSHRAGAEGAKYGSLIAGSISLLKAVFSVAQEKKQIGEAAQNVATDTVKGYALGYSAAAGGSAVKGYMQQSGSQTLRTLAGTNAPALAVTICLSLGSSVKRYVGGEISEAQFLDEVGEKGAGMLSSSMMAALGQLAMPIPFVGAAVGGMIGYTLSSFFYQSALEAAHDVVLSRENLERIKAIEVAARDRIIEEQAALEAFISREMPQLRAETKRLFTSISSGTSDVDELAGAINEYAILLGKRLQFQSKEEFEDFMSSDKPLKL